MAVIIRCYIKFMNDNEKLTKGSLILITPIIFYFTELKIVEIEIFKHYTILIIILNGLIFGFFTSKLIVCSMAKVIIIFI